MHRIYPIVTALFLVFSPLVVDALQVTPGSKCAKACLNSGSDNPWKKSNSNTNITDVTCTDSSYLKTEVGQHYQRCLTCLQRSNRVWDGESDLKWFVYNLRYTLDACLFSVPSQPTYEGNNSCASGCRALKPSLSHDKLEPDPNLAWDYCAADDGNFMGDSMSVCRDCLRNSNEQAYMANFITALEAGCRQTPNDGDVLGLSATVFSKSTVDIIDPQRVTNPDAPSGELPAPAIAGIVVGAVLVSMIAVCLLMVHCRRDRRYGSWEDPYESDDPYHHHQPRRQYKYQSPHRFPNSWTARGSAKAPAAPSAVIVRPYHGEEVYMGPRSQNEKTTPIINPRFTAASRSPGGPGDPGIIELGGRHPSEGDTQGYQSRSQSTIVTPVPSYVGGEESYEARRGRSPPPSPPPRREQQHEQEEEEEADYFSHRAVGGGERRSLQPPPPLTTFGLPPNPRPRSNTPDSYAEQAYLAAAEESERIAARHAARRASEQPSPRAGPDGDGKRFAGILPGNIAAKLKLSSLFRSSSQQQPIVHISAPILETSPRYSIAPRGPVVLDPTRQKRVVPRPRQQAVTSDVYG